SARWLSSFSRDVKGLALGAPDAVAGTLAGGVAGAGDGFVTAAAGWFETLEIGAADAVDGSSHVGATSFIPMTPQTAPEVKMHATESALPSVANFMAAGLPDSFTSVNVASRRQKIYRRADGRDSGRSLHDR